MTRGFSYSKPLAAATVAAVIVAGAVSWTHAVTKTRILDQRRRGGVMMDEMTSQIAAKAEYEEANLEALRARVVQFKKRLGNAGAWQSLAARLSAGWHADPTKKEDRRFYTVESGSFLLLSHSVGDWPDIVSAVHDLESIPGVDVAEMEMRTSGDGVRRILDTARIVVVARTTAAPAVPKSIP
jgi:hypothetical protein